MSRRRPLATPAAQTCAFAIDLGITHGHLAVCSGRTTSLVRDEAGAAAVPMVVASAEGKILVGHSARRQQLINPATIFGISRLLGRRAGSAALTAIQRRLPFRLGSDAGGGVAIQLGERTCTPEELCGLLLSRLRSMAEAYMGEPVTSLLIAVPAYFDEAQQRAVQSAAALAGLEAGLIEAPRAALRAFFPEALPAGTRQLVMHLGGASCEVTLLDVGTLGMEKLAESGDAFLGGEALDAAIVELLLKETQAAGRPELRADPLCRQRLLEAAEHAKWEAGESGEASIVLPHLHASGGEELHLRASLPRAHVEALAQPLLQRLREMCRATLQRAGVEASQVDGVVLVGGQTRLPCVRDAVISLFGGHPYWEPEPEATVARGAALEALLLAEPPAMELALDI